MLQENYSSNPQSYPTPRMIVTLTSFPAAIQYAEGAIKSILKGNLLPDKVVLYLTFNQFGEIGLPESLLRLEKENPLFEIRDYPKDIRSYRKLIPAIKDFPDDIIVTVDDDVEYHPDMLKNLIEIHKAFPKDVIAHRAKKLIPGKSYKDWKKFRWYHFLFRKFHKSPLILQTGVGGVLYPPGALKKEMTDSELFTEIAPTTDDIWFWAAAIANDNTVIPVPFGKNKPKSLGKPKSLSLKTINFKGSDDRNLSAFNDILDHFPEIREKLNL